MALQTLHRVADTVRSTQTDQETSTEPRLLGPDGRYEHVPLRSMRVRAADFDALSAAAAELGNRSELKRSRRRSTCTEPTGAHISDVPTRRPWRLLSGPKRAGRHQRRFDYKIFHSIYLFNPLDGPVGESKPSRQVRLRVEPQLGDGVGSVPWS